MRDIHLEIEDLGNLVRTQIASVVGGHSVEGSTDDGLAPLVHLPPLSPGDLVTKTPLPPEDTEDRAITAASDAMSPGGSDDLIARRKVAPSFRKAVMSVRKQKRTLRSSASDDEEGSTRASSQSRGSAFARGRRGSAASLQRGPSAIFKRSSSAQLGKRATVAGPSAPNILDGMTVALEVPIDGIWLEREELMVMRRHISNASATLAVQQAQLTAMRLMFQTALKRQRDEKGSAWYTVQDGESSQKGRGGVHAAITQNAAARKTKTPDLDGTPGDTSEMDCHSAEHHPSHRSQVASDLEAGHNDSHRSHDHGHAAVRDRHMLVNDRRLVPILCSNTSTEPVSLHGIMLNDGHCVPMMSLAVKTPPGEETYDLVVEALKLGYRHIDTAQFYGNEVDVGRAIRASGIPREEIWITAKLWPYGLSVEDPGRSALAKGYATVRNFESYVDLFLLHTPAHPEYRHKLWLVIEDLQRRGLAKSIGVANHGVHHLKELLSAKGTHVVPAVNQIEVHPYLIRDELVDFCESRNIAVGASSPLGKGGSALFNPTLSSVATVHHVTAAQVLLRWAIQRGHITATRMSSATHLAENAAIFNFELTPSEISQLCALDRGQALGWDPTTWK
eukprot:NODE_2280_length_2249_cov_8.148445.p1 GENE.NODE_2280_length_2249_cov_8.148445~~NODE_2280_length_2249_cov_8.148445.p1  ORF type:complete len:618 (+),score=122.16 NODE_2280_length_2249_cov_8.148445:96-1949(+)